MLDKNLAIAAAVSQYSGKWPRDLTSGVMYYMGVRITRREFQAHMMGDRV